MSQFGEVWITKLSNWEVNNNTFRTLCNLQGVLYGILTQKYAQKSVWKEVPKPNCNLLPIQFYEIPLETPCIQSGSALELEVLGFPTCTFWKNPFVSQDCALQVSRLQSLKFFLKFFLFSTFRIGNEISTNNSLFCNSHNLGHCYSRL